MDISHLQKVMHGMAISYDDNKASTKEYAALLDKQDSLAHFRDEFLIPTKGDLRDPDEEELSHGEHIIGPALYPLHQYVATMH